MHFGRAPAFTFIDVEDGRLINKNVVENPGAIQYTPGSVPKFLYEQRTRVIVSGGMGGRAIQFFEQFKIRVILGASGSVEDTIQTILKGELKDGVNIAHPDGQHSGCGDHKHNHNCGNH